MHTTPDHALAGVQGLLRRTPVFVAGSCVAAQTYGKPDAWSDLDVFVPTQQVLISTVQTLLNHGYTLDDRFERVWHRWLKYGLKGWHTNSMRLHSVDDVETNVVYKLVDGHPTTSLAQVLESFDFGLLATGYDLETDQFRDMRDYLFPGLNPVGPLPMMPSKRDNWINGFISQYNGLREAGRYAKYHAYGYDMSAVRSDLLTGYRMAADYMLDHYKEDKRTLGEIYVKIAERIEADEIDDLAESYKVLDFSDPLDLILEALE